MLVALSQAKTMFASLLQLLEGWFPNRSQEEYFDVRWLTPTPPMTEEEIAAKYRQGRVAEIGL